VPTHFEDSLQSSSVSTQPEDANHRDSWQLTYARLYVEPVPFAPKASLVRLGDDDERLSMRFTTLFPKSRPKVDWYGAAGLTLFFFVRDVGAFLSRVVKRMQMI